MTIGQEGLPLIRRAASVLARRPGRPDGDRFHGIDAYGGDFKRWLGEPRPVRPASRLFRLLSVARGWSWRLTQDRCQTLAGGCARRQDLFHGEP